LSHLFILCEKLYLGEAKHIIGAWWTNWA